MAYRPIFFTLVSKNTIELQQSKQLRNKEQNSYSEVIRDFKHYESSSKGIAKSDFGGRRLLQKSFFIVLLYHLPTSYL